MRKELITIAFSHYCEKARWALDRKRVAYRELRYMPTLHFPKAAWALAGTGIGRADRASSRFSTPILLGDHPPIADSSDIVRFVDPALYDHPEAGALDRHFSDDLGPHTRRVVYWFALSDRRLLFELADQNVSARQALAFRALFPLGRRFLASRLGVNERGFERSLDRTRRILDEVGHRLRDGRPYLLGDRFTAADLSFASMIAPAILPSQYGAVLPSAERLPERARDVIAEVRAHAAGAFAKRMFDEERERRT